MTTQVSVFDFYSLTIMVNNACSPVTKYIPKPIKRFFNRQMALVSYQFLSREIKDLADKQTKIAGVNNLSAINGVGLTQLALEYGKRQEFLLRTAEENGARKIKLIGLEVWV